MKRLVLPKLYVILDAALLNSTELEMARRLTEAGVRLLQYRNKTASSRGLFDSARDLAGAIAPTGANFFVNDRPDIAFLSEASGVHVGQDDLTVEQAREIIGEGKWVGVSTHSLPQFQAAAQTSADYIAVGPIFSTRSKINPDPVVGLDLLKRVRPLTQKPIVAIGGITLERAADVIGAGADVVAVISDVLQAPDPAKRARQYLELLEPRSLRKAN